MIKGIINTVRDRINQKIKISIVVIPKPPLPGFAWQLTGIIKLV
jgi:hypothetical protein